MTLARLTKKIFTQLKILVNSKIFLFLLKITNFLHFFVIFYDFFAIFIIFL